MPPPASCASSPRPACTRPSRSPPRSRGPSDGGADREQDVGIRVSVQESVHLFVGGDHALAASEPVLAALGIAPGRAGGLQHLGFRERRQVARVRGLATSSKALEVVAVACLAHAVRPERIVAAALLAHPLLAAVGEFRSSGRRARSARDPWMIWYRPFVARSTAAPRRSRRRGCRSGLPGSGGMAPLVLPPVPGLEVAAA